MLKNLLKKNNEDDAIVFKSENGNKKVLSWKELNLRCCCSFSVDEI